MVLAVNERSLSRSAHAPYEGPVKSEVGSR
jgi:hypothetical protein